MIKQQLLGGEQLIVSSRIVALSKVLELIEQSKEGITKLVFKIERENEDRKE